VAVQEIAYTSATCVLSVHVVTLAFFAAGLLRGRDVVLRGFAGAFLAGALTRTGETDPPDEPKSGCSPRYSPPPASSLA
jgi:hypothetical protein